MTTDRTPDRPNSPAPAAAWSAAAMAVARFVCEDLVALDRAGRLDVCGIAARTAIAWEILSPSGNFAKTARELGIPRWRAARLRQQMRAVIDRRIRQAGEDRPPEVHGSLVDC
jgi:hypothetical protein